jgi:hypothetical protein
MTRKKYVREKAASASVIGLGIGWLLTYLYVYLVYLSHYDINIVSPTFIGAGAILYAAALLYLDGIIEAFIKALGISMFVTGLLYYTTLLVI